MSDIPEGFSGLALTNYFKYLLYLAGIIFILTYAVDVKAATDISRVRYVCIAIILAGCIIWFSNEIIMDQVRQKSAKAQLDEHPERYLREWKSLNLTYIWIQAIVWFLFVIWYFVSQLF